MRSASSLLEELRTVDESPAIEAKRCLKVDRSVLETVCAFANEPGLGGGHLLLGVATSEQLGLFGRTYEVVGVESPDQVLADLATQCATSLNRPVRPQMRTEILDGRVVVVVFVAELAAAEKPVFLKSLGLPRGAFRRTGSTDQEGTDDDLIALYQGHQSESFDSSVVRDVSLADLDPDAIRTYREMRHAANSLAEELSWPDDELLRALGAVTREGDRLVPTAAGVLLFGTAPTLRRCFPMMRVDYVRVPGREWVSDPGRRFDTVEIRAPLILAARRAIAAVRDDLPAAFHLPEGAITRTDETVLPVRVLREAIVNALMHRSYRIHGPIQILRYANRLEVRNPGHSLKAEEQLGEPGSQTRNPRIAAVLHEVHLAETKGSGIRAMRELMLSNGLLPPSFESSRQPDQFVATFLFHHLLGKADVDWLGRLSAEGLSDEDARALVFVREAGAIDNATFRGLTRSDVLSASLRLRRLRDQGLLEMKGSGNRTYYVPGPVMVAAGGMDAARSDVGGSDRSATAKVTDVHHPGPDLHQSPPDLHQSPSDLHQLEGSLPPNLVHKLTTLGARPRQEVLRALILELCAHGPKSAAELATLLGDRDAKNLVRLHLGPMLESGQLVHTVPKMPNHPQQKYTLAEGSDA